MQANVSTPERWDQDYRIPDLCVYAAERPPALDAAYGQPVAVLEIRSPGDETYDRLPFYAAVGVRAVVVIDRDTKAVQVYRLTRGDFLLEPPQPDGWTLVEPIDVELRSEVGEGHTRLRLRLRGAAATERSVG